MSAKVVLVFCAQALFIQNAFSQCIGRGAIAAPGIAAPAAALAGSGSTCGAGLGYGASLGYGAGAGYGAGVGYGVGAGYGALAIEAIPTSGGALPITSLSAIAPTGLAIDSENVYEGALSVTGELPFLSAVALEGVLASGGAGVVNHACGSGVGIVAENIAPAAGYGAAGAYGLGVGYGAAGAYGLGAGYGATGAYGLGAGYGAAGAYGLGAAYGNGAAAIAPAALGRGNGARGCGCGLY